MAQIIKFRPRESNDARRLKALVKGKIDVYMCDTCGEEFEVIDGEFPKTCPCCNITITQWNSEENDT